MVVSQGGKFCITILAKKMQCNDILLCLLFIVAYAIQSLSQTLKQAVRICYDL